MLPGIIDPHVHVSGRFGSPVGFRMLVRAGVTAALDLAGDPAELKRTLPARGCGLTIGALFPLIPGETISGAEPSEKEIESTLDLQLEQGALGLKILGGHYPLTPDATAQVIATCASRGAYCAVHAGTTATGSDITGLEELVHLAGATPLHIAHVNSYCRGQIEDPIVEVERALRALASLPAAWSESYLSLINGADARCADGIPVSRVVRTCLRLGGYPETEAGIEQAIRDGWGLVQHETAEEVGFADATTGLELFHRQRSEIGISFPVNPPSAAIALALARADGDRFAIDALSSDGGAIPRNTTLSQALSLVAGQFLNLHALVEKAVVAPAKRLGLPNRGPIAPGAGADLVVVDHDGNCTDSIVRGELVVRDRRITKADGGTLLRPK